VASQTSLLLQVGSCCKGIAGLCVLALKAYTYIGLRARGCALLRFFLFHVSAKDKQTNNR
jgi:hypothetical protein